MAQLAATGANSIRTWGVEGADAILDEAHALGLTVTIGIWLGHERHGFDYGDEAQVAEQMARAKAAVLAHKDHPALLMWGIGNEMEGFGDGNDPTIWKAVNDIAAMVKELDPHHPTMTVTAEIGGDRVEWLHRRSPAIDVHGINSYGGAPSLPKRLAEAGATKPYVLTEFGTVGSWESGKTAWGSPYEQTSTEKAAFFKLSYESAVLEQPGKALGAYVFTWGFKMEGTATWLGLLLPDGSTIATVDAMTEYWTGEPPANRSPVVTPLRIDGPDQVKPGALISVSTDVSDPESKSLTARWTLRPESSEMLTGGDFRRDLPDIPEAIVEATLDDVRLRMPPEPGAYRLFYYVNDGAGKAATASLPILVMGTPRPRLPIDVYTDGLEAMPWAPAGWMGNVDDLTLDGDYRASVHRGDRSVRLHYTGTFNWVGVAWQHPPNNWGDQEGGFDVTGARALEVWARGEYGGEKVTFGVGIIGNDKPFADSAIVKGKAVELTDSWTRYTVPLSRKDLSSIKTAFVITISGRRTPVTVYLDDVRFVK
ncbi:MAG: glycoside hydrolase family 2 TIM barrel-domain containing protein [Pseudomonadota bacterium]